MKESWKDIPGYEGIYEASTHGHIRSKEGKVTHSKLHGERKWKSRIIKPKACSDFYKTGYRVTLWKDKKPHDYLIARLICTTFKENLINTSMTVNHIDGDRLNNNIDNLEWVSRADNIRHAFNNGLYSSQKSVVLKGDGCMLYFRSLSHASRFLRRNHGYISGCVEHGRPITDDIGNEYKVINDGA